MLPLIYEITLSRDDARDPDDPGLAEVGKAKGAIDLPANRTKTVQVEIDVTEVPNGSRVSVFDRRTPEFVRETINP